MKILYITLVFFFTKFSFSQHLELSKDDPDYERHSSFIDSIQKIKLKPDIKSIYKITKIIDSIDSHYIIYAEKVNGKPIDFNDDVIYTKNSNYLYRIKSKKNRRTCSKNKEIKTRNLYQLDLRNYNNINNRLHFIPGVALNLLTNSGFGFFDVIVHIDEKMTDNYFNKAMNLRGLCLCKKKKHKINPKH